MNPSNVLKQDFSEVLVPFDVVKVKNCSVAYINKPSGLSSEELATLIEKHAFIVNTPDSTHISKHELQELYAERYGGSGILRHGGGARCGLMENYQIKGIGRNPLLGQGANLAHSHGELSLVDALYEALWSRIFKIFLPYGIIDVEFIIKTPIKYFDQDAAQTNRALLIRKPHLRPAHFFSASYFECPPEWISESARVRTSIQKILNHLPMPGKLNRGSLEPIDLAFEGVIELSRRYIDQLAETKTRRLFHPTSPSNSTMDGAWLDFGTVIQRDFPENESGLGVFEDENHKAFRFLYEMIMELSFYIEKYRPDCSGLSKKISSTLIGYIKPYLEEKLEFSLLRSFGVPFDSVNGNDYSDTAYSFAKLLIYIQRKRKLIAGSEDISRLGSIVILLVENRGKIFNPAPPEGLFRHLFGSHFPRRVFESFKALWLSVQKSSKVLNAGEESVAIEIISTTQRRHSRHSEFDELVIKKELIALLNRGGNLVSATDSYLRNKLSLAEYFFAN